MSVWSKLSTLLLRDSAQIGQLRSAQEVARWTALLPHHALAAAPPGKRCVVQGRVEALLPLHQSPLSGRSSVFTQIEIEDGSPARESDARTTFEFGSDFLVRDGTAAARVPRGLVSLGHNDPYRVGLQFKALTAQELSVNAGFWMERRAMLGSSRFGYREWSVGPGDLVQLLCCVREGPPDATSPTAETAGSYRAAPRGLLLDAADDALFLYLSLLPEP